MRVDKKKPGWGLEHTRRRVAPSFFRIVGCLIRRTYYLARALHREKFLAETYYPVDMAWVPGAAQPNPQEGGCGSRRAVGPASGFCFPAPCRGAPLPRNWRVWTRTPEACLHGHGAGQGPARSRPCLVTTSIDLRLTSALWEDGMSSRAAQPPTGKATRA